MTGPLGALLDVEAVMARYAIRDPRAARRVMDIAGAFQIAGRLLVSADSLAALEQRLAVERKTRAAGPAPRPRRSPASDTRHDAMGPDWWLADETPSRTPRSTRREAA